MLGSPAKHTQRCAERMQKSSGCCIYAVVNNVCTSQQPAVSCSFYNASYTRKKILLRSRFYAC